MTNNAHSFLLACGKMRFQLVFFFSLKESHLTITCSKLTTEILQYGVKYIQNQQKRHQNEAWQVYLLLTLNIFHILF